MSLSRRTFCAALATVAAPNFNLRPGEPDRYAGLSPEADAAQVGAQVRQMGNTLVSQFPDLMADVVTELVLRIRYLEDRQR